MIKVHWMMEKKIKKFNSKICWIHESIHLSMHLKQINSNVYDHKKCIEVPLKAEILWKDRIFSKMYLFKSILRN